MPFLLGEELLCWREATSGIPEGMIVWQIWLDVFFEIVGIELQLILIFADVGVTLNTGWEIYVVFRTYWNP